MGIGCVWCDGDYSITSSTQLLKSEQILRIFFSILSSSLAYIRKISNFLSRFYFNLKSRFLVILKK